MSNARIAIVGGCAAGKSSLAQALRARGIDAWAVAQEHSAVADLWRHQHPDHLVVLLASLETVRRRRQDPGWPRWIWEMQQARMANAREHADIIIETDALSKSEIELHVVDTLRL